MALGSKLPFGDTYKGKQNEFLWPDSNVDPNYKSDPEGKYVKTILESIYAHFYNGSLGNTFTFSEADLIRSYGRGEQPESIYRKWASSINPNSGGVITTLVDGYDSSELESQERLSKGWDRISFSVESPMPQIKDLILGMLDKVDYDIHADTLDPVSNDKKEKERLKLLVQSKYQDWFEQQYASMNIPSDKPEYLPKNKEELDVFESYGGLKLQCARIMQMLIRFTYEISSYDKVIREHMINDFLDLGSAVIQDRVDLDDMRVKAEYVDRKCFIIQPTNRMDRSDATYAAVLKEYDISYLVAMGIDRKRLEPIARDYCGILGNPTKFDNYASTIINPDGNFDFFKVLVLEGSWIDEDTAYKRYVKNRFDRVKPYNVDFGYVATKSNEWVKTYKRRVLYEGSWVVNSNITFSYGVAYNQPRSEGKLKLPFHYYELQTKSMTRRLMPLLDEFMFNKLNAANGLSLALPDGIAIDVSMMTNVDIVKGKTATLTDIIEFARAFRVYAHSQSISGKYEGGNPTPFSVVQGITERILADFNTRLDICMKNIATVTGINPMASQQSGGTATGSQLAYNATVQVLKPLVKGLFSIKESCAENVCWRIQNAIKYEPTFKKSYSSVLSSNDIKVLSDAEGWEARYGIMLLARPSEADVQNIMNSVNLEITKGTLDSTDSMFIIEQLNSGVDHKLIRMFMTAKITKNKEIMHQQQMEAIERQNQGNVQVNQQQGQNQQAAMQMEFQKMMAEIQAKSEAEMKKVTKQGEDKLQETIMKIQAELQKMIMTPKV